MLDKLKQSAQVNSISLVNKEQRNAFYWSMSWINTRRQILRRDNYECQVCKYDGKVTTLNQSRLIVHHVKPLEFYPDLKLDHDNLLTVCHQCHNAIHFESAGSAWDDEWW